MDLLSRLYREEEGQGLTEYALILALIVIVVAVALSPLGEQIAQVFTDTTDELTEVVAP